MGLSGYERDRRKWAAEDARTDRVMAVAGVYETLASLYGDAEERCERFMQALNVDAGEVREGVAVGRMRVEHRLRA